MVEIIENNEMSPSSNKLMQHHRRHHHNTASTNPNNVKQQQFPQMKQKTIRRHFQKVIQGYHMERKDWTRLYAAEFAVKIVFWTPIYIIFAYMTITSSIDIFQQYQANPIYVSMTAMINQPSVPFPNYTVCLYLNVTEMFDAADVSNRNGSNTSYLIDLKKFFSDNADAIKNGKFNLAVWPNTTNGVIVRYLIMMYESESESEATEPQFDLQQFQRTNEDYWAAVRNVLIPKIAEYNISIDQLKATFEYTFYGFSNNYEYEGSNISCMLQINVLSTDCVASKNISFIGQDSICFRFLSNDVHALPIAEAASTGEGIAVHITINGADGEENQTNWLYSLDFTGRNTPPPKSQ
jgi:hypothetical protein